MRNAKAHYPLSVWAFTKRWVQPPTFASHSRNLQQACGSCKRRQRKDVSLHGFYALYRDVGTAWAVSDQSPGHVLSLVLLSNEGNKSNGRCWIRKPAMQKQYCIFCSGKSLLLLKLYNSSVLTGFTTHFHHEWHSPYPNSSVYRLTTCSNTKLGNQGISHKANITHKKGICLKKTTLFSPPFLISQKSQDNATDWIWLLILSNAMFGSILVSLEVCNKTVTAGKQATSKTQLSASNKWEAFKVFLFQAHKSSFGVLSTTQTPGGPIWKVCKV